MSPTNPSRTDSTQCTLERRERLQRRLVSTVRRLVGRPHGHRTPLPDGATTDMRLRHLEAEVAEVRTRVNGLFYAVLASLALEVVGKVAV